ncbi:Trafficking protein particle complex subunit 11 [Strongyloides ratti]|uniref:Trafficking protein particle complex subunit 11 n=1 Tax=Strongyloides ratti TaxID=34506 RepID=A0A090LK15_STRRB|nr:Trafficking protein particle complex subunit 11 [Strongyloides ratti]CEF67880.1 Trafficking protein particle complex subunit 11 [Strongyloides ratti]
MEPADVTTFLPKDKLRHLVLLSGLDVVNNPFHKAIYSNFQTRSLAPDCCPLTYKIFTPENIIEIPKLIKNQSRILRFDWPLKYTHIYPAAIVLFYDLNWSTVNWEEKKRELETKIDALRNVIQKDGKPYNKGTQIILVIIQHNEGVTKEENDKLCNPKAAEILSLVKLKNNQLFVIPDTETTLYNFILRLEKQFYELTPIFYQECIRKIRSRNIPNNNSILLIRQQFKLAFLSELRQDNHTAMRNYKLAYQKCAELDMVDRDAYEILSVASVINYKICQLSFQNNLIRESFTQYVKHQNTFFNRKCGVYPDPYIAKIEFNLWKREQCVLFAKLFEKAISNGLLAIIHKNPGIYYQSAAEFQRCANIYIKEMLATISYNENNVVREDVLSFNKDLSKTHTIYFGQRPWRVLTDLMPDNVFDNSHEKSALLTLQSKILPNYQQTIQLYNIAMKHFEKFQAHRFQTRIKSQIADELISSGNYKQAQLYLYDILMEYYKSRNFVLTQNLLVKFLEIAFLNANLNDYIWAISQLSSSRQYTFLTVNVSQHTNFYTHNLISLFQGVIPAPLKSGVIPLIDSELNSIFGKWQQTLSDKPIFKINLTGLVCFLEVSVSLTQLSIENEYGNENCVLARVNIFNDLNCDISFGKLTLYIEDCCKVPSIVTNDVLENATLKLYKNDIIIEKNSRKSYFFYFNPEKLSTTFLTNNIQIESLVLSGVSLTKTLVNGSFHWDFPINDPSSSVVIKKRQLPLDTTILVSSTIFYFGEKFLLPINICNSSKLKELSKLECTISLSNQEINQVDIKADKKIYLLDPYTKTKVSSFVQIIESLAIDGSFLLNVQFDTDKPNDFYIHLNIKSSDDNSSFFKSFKVSTIQPVKWNCTIVSLANEILNQITNNTHSMIQFDFETCTEMVITSVLWNLNSYLTPTSQVCENYTVETYQSLELSSILSYLITFIASLPFGRDESINLGKITLSWKRPSTTTINNTTIDLEAFMFCGDKEQTLTLMPGEIFENCLTLFALTAGRLPYPKLNLSFVDESNTEFPKICQELALKSLPTRIFVMSTGKS